MSRYSSHPIRRRRGIIFSVALCSLLVMLIVGISFMGASVQVLSNARRDMTQLHAVAMADAGIQYLIWRQKYSSQPIAIGSIFSDTTNVSTLDYTKTPAAQIQLALGDGGQDHAAIWLCNVTTPGQTPGYQAISQGYYRDYARSESVV